MRLGRKMISRSTIEARGERGLGLITSLAERGPKILVPKKHVCRVG
jgi:hypothetical protein